VPASLGDVLGATLSHPSRVNSRGPARRPHGACGARGALAQRSRFMAHTGI